MWSALRVSSFSLFALMLIGLFLVGYGMLTPALFSIMLALGLSFWVVWFNKESLVGNATEPFLGVVGLVLGIAAYRAYQEGTFALALVGHDLHSTSLLALASAAVLFWATVQADVSTLRRVVSGFIVASALYGLVGVWSFFWGGGVLNRSVIGWGDGHIMLLSVWALVFLVVRERKVKVWQGVFGAACLIAGLFFLISPYVVQLPKQSGVSSAPPMAQSYTVASTALGADIQTMVLGTGPSTFSRVWSQYVSADVNTTSWWDQSPWVGSGFLVTIFAEYGLIGGGLLCLLLLVVLAHAMKRMRLSDRVAVVVLLGSLYVIGLFVFVSMSTPLLLTTIFIIGVLIAQCKVNEQPAGLRKPSSLSTLLMYVWLVGLMLCIMLAVTAAITTQLRVRTIVQATIAGTIDGELLDGLAPRQPSFIFPVVRQFEVVAALHNSIAGDPSLDPIVTEPLRRLLLTYAIDYAQTARRLDSRPEWILAEMELRLLENRKNVYLLENDVRRVLVSKPQDPRAHYINALVALAKEDYVRAQKHLDTALVLKPDFTPAQILRRDLTDFLQQFDAELTAVDREAADIENP